MSPVWTIHNLSKAKSAEGAPDNSQGYSEMNAVHGAEPLSYGIMSMRSEGQQEKPVWMLCAPTIVAHLKLLQHVSTHLYGNPFSVPFLADSNSNCVLYKRAESPNSP